LPCASRAFTESAAPRADRRRLRVAASNRAEQIGRPLTRVGPARRPCARDSLQEGRRRLERFVPRARGSGPWAPAPRWRLAVSTRSRTARSRNLEAVSVGVREIDADSRPYGSGDVTGTSFALSPLYIRRGLRDSPCARRRDSKATCFFCGPMASSPPRKARCREHARVRRPGRRPHSSWFRKHHGVLSMRAEHVRVPLVGSARIADEVVDVIDGHRVCRPSPSPGEIAFSGVYSTGGDPRDRLLREVLSAPLDERHELRRSEQRGGSALRGRRSGPPGAASRHHQTWSGRDCSITFRERFRERRPYRAGTTAFATTVRIRVTASAEQKD